MPRRYPLGCRPRLGGWSLFVAGVLALSGFSLRARADQGVPPESPYAPEPGPERTQIEHLAPAHEHGGGVGQPSSGRLHVGPASSIAHVGPGLLAALDLGEGAVGGRLQAMWVHSGAASGFSGYSAELWAELLHRSAFHPILGAGAGYLRGGGAGPGGAAGVASLRCALEYELQLSEADARVGLSVVTLLPAIGSEREEPWLVGAFTLGAGF